MDIINAEMILNKLYEQVSLTQEESHHLFECIIKGELDPILLSAALTAFKIKGETPDEIAGAASALTQDAIPFPSPHYDFADIVGTGGDGANTFNISTTSAFVAAACGVKIAKHGNRGVSSQSGSSDLLAAFGVDLAMSPERARLALDELGVCFLFAPQYHLGVRHAMPVRQTMKTRTIFNLLGPLINPAKPKRQLMGVYDRALIAPMSQSLLKLGLTRAIVVHGSGLDEVAIHGQTDVAEINEGKITQYTLTPADFGLATYPLHAIKGGNPQQNKEIITRVLQGKGTDAQHSVVAANVALLLRVFGHEDLKENALKAQKVMKSGKPYELIRQLALRSQ